MWQLNQLGIDDILISDKLKMEEKWCNISKTSYYDWIDRDELFDFLYKTNIKIEAIIHMGACSATTEKDADFLMKNNYEYTKKLWNYCTEKQIKFIYASSAATYGDGEKGYDDNISLEEHENLRPLNKYGYSKKIFDVWALKQEKTPKIWAGLKFFNVYGPNEYHKGRMASMIFHAYNQYNETGDVKLFKSHKDGYRDGEQLRDFVYIKDVTKVIVFMLGINNENTVMQNGIYNLGTGKARSFYDLAKITLECMGGSKDNIKFIPMPEDLRGRYQYFTEAKMNKLIKNGYTESFYSLEDGVRDYVINYLLKEDKYL